MYLPLEPGINLLLRDPDWFQYTLQTLRYQTGDNVGDPSEMHNPKWLIYTVQYIHLCLPLVHAFSITLPTALIKSKHAEEIVWFKPYVSHSIHNLL